MICSPYQKSLLNNGKTKNSKGNSKGRSSNKYLHLGKSRSSTLQDKRACRKVGTKDTVCDRDVCISCSDSILFAPRDNERVDNIYDLKSNEESKGDSKYTSCEDVQYFDTMFPTSLHNTAGCCSGSSDKKHNCGECKKTVQQLMQGAGYPLDGERDLQSELKNINNQVRLSAKTIHDCKTRLKELHKKPHLTETDAKELSSKTTVLLQEISRFDKLMRNVQKIVKMQVIASGGAQQQTSVPSSQKFYQVPVFQNDKAQCHSANSTACCDVVLRNPNCVSRNESEINLSRKLSESYSLQERLVADNVDLEVKRNVIYKELLNKDQNLDFCRSQIDRLQNELKLLTKENNLLVEKVNEINKEINRQNRLESGIRICCNNLHLVDSDTNTDEILAIDSETTIELYRKLEDYKASTNNLVKDLKDLEYEVRNIQVEMAGMCGGGKGPNICYKEGEMPPPPPLMKECGACPPCPAPCNPFSVLTPAEKDVHKLTIQLRQTEENFKTKITECAVLRAELLKKKEELEKERCQHRQTQNSLRELEMKFEGLTTQTNMHLGTFEQALEREINVATLKRCYKEARAEIDELRTLMKEQNEQIQDYRVKYLQAQQLVEEQKKQMDMMDMDNTRISEQINLEIQKVKIKFQEKLQELAPLPDLLKATQMRLKDAQQSQAIAEHNAEQLARELNCAREKVHVLLHAASRAPEKPDTKGDADKQINLLNQRISQMAEAATASKQEIERLKAQVIRMEEHVLVTDRRLQEKFHECAQLGGELDRARDEAARALQRASERNETMRKCLQTTVAELERQLAAVKAQKANADKQREETQHRMQCQINRLNDNFEQAQFRIIDLKGQVVGLKKVIWDQDKEEEDIPPTCKCKSFIEGEIGTR